MCLHQNIGIGLYTAPEAARLLHIPQQNIRRWLSGYTFGKNSKKVTMPPLWLPQLPLNENHLELGFRDLIELRFVAAFVNAGLSIKTIRNCLNSAKDIVSDDRPFSTRKFQTDGKTIFLESATAANDVKVLDLKKHQYAIKIAIEQSFKDLDIEQDAVTRWRPFNGKNTIVVDPTRSFGQPIASNYGIPTITLAQAVEAEGSESAVSKLFEVPILVVRDAVNFEKSLLS